MNLGPSLKMYFIVQPTPSLERVEFGHPLLDEVRVAVRGKTGGAFRTDKSFQWTSAVQALAILVLRTMAFNARKSSDQETIEPLIDGEQGSLAISLDYSIDKNTTWITDIFGSDSKGQSLIRRLLKRSNPGHKRAGPVSIGLNESFLPLEKIAIYVNGIELKTFDEMYNFLRATEKACAAVRIERSRALPEETSAPEIHEFVASPPAFVAGENPPAFKTPYIRQSSGYGELCTRVYEKDGLLALVSLFSSPEDIRGSSWATVRIHSSCANSDILGTTDCDCRSQLLRALDVLKRKKGILIHLFQEGRGAGLLSKYMGMAVMQRKSVSTYEAYRELSLVEDTRKYELAHIILKDLGVTNVELLSNNPKKIESLKNAGFQTKHCELFGEVSPQNFSYLYSKLEQGSHQIAPLFERKSPLFFCCEGGIPKSFSRVWIIDTDDTLWEDNVLYEDIIRRFIDYMSLWLPQLRRDEIRHLIDSIELKVIPQYGYGPEGFEKSLTLAYEQMRKSYEAEIPAPTTIFQSILPRLTSVPQEISSDCISTLGALRKRGDGLILFSEGPHKYQVQKIAKSRLGEYFHAIALAEFKNIETYRMITETFPATCKEYIAVGNTLKSDIAPARELGFKCVHYQNPNSWDAMNNTVIDGYSQVTNLSALLSL